MRVARGAVSATAALVVAVAVAVAVLAVLAACGKPETPAKREPTTTQPTTTPLNVDPADKKLATIEMVVPPGWTSKYDAAGDRWLLEANAPAGAASARIERAPATWVASPDAYLAQRKRYDLGPGTKAEFEKRESIKDGFAMTVLVTPPADRGPPRRETYAVRQLGSAWYQCVSDSVPDDAFRDQLVALCKSLKL
jgi:hypothetical protein